MSPNTATHVHLLLCHAPLLLVLLSLAFLVLGMGRGNLRDQRIALALSVAAALIALPLYFSGAPSMSLLTRLPDYMDSIVERHRTVAALAMAGCGLLGVTALAALIFFDRGTIPRGFGIAMILAAFFVSAILVWTANIGGEIRHSEIRPVSSTQLERPR